MLLARNPDKVAGLRAGGRHERGWGANAQRQSTDEAPRPSAPASPQPEPMSTVVEQSGRNAMVILNLTWFPIRTYPCAGRRI
jgi:hypothetical protein